MKPEQIESLATNVNRAINLGCEMKIDLLKRSGVISSYEQETACKSAFYAGAEVATVAIQRAYKTFSDASASQPGEAVSTPTADGGTAEHNVTPKG